MIKIHPKVSKIIMQDGSRFTCPFCHVALQRAQTTSSEDRIFYDCVNQSCQYIFSATNYFTFDNINRIPLHTVSNVFFQLDTNVSVNLLFESNKMCLTIRDSNNKTKEVIGVDSLPKFDFNNIDEIKQKLKLYLTFS